MTAINNRHFLPVLAASYLGVLAIKRAVIMKKPFLFALAAIGLVALVYKLSYNTGFERGLKSAQKAPLPTEGSDYLKAIEELDQLETTLKKPVEDFKRDYLKLNETIGIDFKKLIKLTKPENLQDLPFSLEEGQDSKDYVGWFISVINFLTVTGVRQTQDNIIRLGKTHTPEGNPPFDCPICLGEDLQGDRFVASCGHILCLGCKDRTFEQAGPNCPTCRTPLQGYEMFIPDIFQVFKKPDMAGKFTSVLILSKQTSIREGFWTPLSEKARELVEQYLLACQRLNEQIGSSQKALLDEMGEVEIPVHIIVTLPANVDTGRTYPFVTHDVQSAHYPRTYTPPVYLGR